MITSLTTVSLFGVEFSAELAFWVAALIILLITEASTTNLTTIWLAAGALVAAILAAVGAGLAIQVIAFIVVSAVLLIFTKPVADKYFKKDGKKTNKDLLIGSKTYVTETIDNLSETGYIKLGDVFWSARSEDGSVIEVGTLVEVKAINGNRLTVAVTENK